MTQEILKQDQVDIYQKPTINKIQYQQVSIGDLHGNAMKFIFFLIKEGIFDLHQKDYLALASIYQQDFNLLDDEEVKGYLHQFNHLVDKLVLKRKALVRLIGDELADRGQNDYFILKILQKLKQQDVPVDILMSNHSIEYIEATERLEERSGKFDTTILDKPFFQGHASSLHNLENLRQRGLISTKEVLEITSTSYKPNIKAVSYSLSEDQQEITLYSHAGIDIHVIALLAEKFNVDFKDDTAVQLAQTIDQINLHISTHIDKGNLHSLYTAEMQEAGYRGFVPLSKESVLEYIMWNRHYHDLKRAPVHKGYNVNYVHGHDSGESCHENIYNLDSPLGKTVNRGFNKGSYLALGSNDHDLIHDLNFKPIPSSPVMQSEDEQKDALIDKLKLNINNQEHMMFWKNQVSFSGATFNGNQVPHTIAKLLKIVENKNVMDYQSFKSEIEKSLKSTSNSWSSFFGLSCLFRKPLIQALRDCENIESFDIKTSFQAKP